MTRRLALLLSLVLTPVGLVHAQQTAPSLPRLVRISGTVSGAHDATLGITFALYQDQTGGAPLWQEVQNVAIDATGHYSILLGATSKDGLPADLFASNEARWLGVQVEQEAEQPRVLLVSVPYALKAGDAETIGGHPVSDFVLSTTNGTDASGGTSTTNGGLVFRPKAKASTTPTALGTVGAGTTNAVAKFDSSGNVVGSTITFDTGSAVGIGTSAPADLLDVRGTARFWNGSFGLGISTESNATVFRDKSAADAWWMVMQPVSSGVQQINFFGGSNVAGASIMAVNGILRPTLLKFGISGNNGQIGLESGNTVFRDTSSPDAWWMSMVPAVSGAAQINVFGGGSLVPGASTVTVNGIVRPATIRMGTSGNTAQMALESGNLTFRDTSVADGWWMSMTPSNGSSGQVTFFGGANMNSASVMGVNGILRPNLIKLGISGNNGQIGLEGVNTVFRDTSVPDAWWLSMAPTTSGVSQINLFGGSSVTSGVLSVAGTVQSTAGGFKFPDGTSQTTAASLTGITAGTGLSGGGATGNVTLSANFSSVQARVTGTCASGTAMASIGSDGSVTCNAVSGGGSSTLSGTVTLASGTNIPSARCITQGVTITGATTSMVAVISPASNPGGSGLNELIWEAFVDAANHVTANLCHFSNTSATSTAAVTFNIRVIP